MTHIVKKNDDNFKNRPKDIEYPGLLPEPNYKIEISWEDTIFYILLHVGAIYGIFVQKSSWTGVIYVLLYTYISGLGITAGAHRYVCHKTFKANLPLKLILIYLNAITFESSIYQWTKWHRLHHKYVDTNADPYSSRRGLFFSHIGWMLTKKHSDVEKFGKKIDMSDLESDKLIMFQHKYKTYFVLVACFIVPMLFLHFYCKETLVTSFTYGVCSRLFASYHMTYLINSASHKYGMRPHDVTISPSDNGTLSQLTLGEGYHNFHHVFPQEYRTSEFGNSFSLTTAFIDFFAWLGWAYDLKTVSPEAVKKRSIRTGDGTREIQRMIIEPIVNHRKNGERIR